MYKQIFSAPVPYRTVDDPSLGSGTPGAVYINYPELNLAYGEVIHSVNGFFVNAENTASSTFTIILSVNVRTIYNPYVPTIMKFDGATGAFLGYEDPFSAPPGYIYSEVVQSIDGSLWASTTGFLVPLDPLTRGAPDQSAWIPATFFEIPVDQQFHEVHKPMVDKTRDVIVMSATPVSVDGRYILVNRFSTGELLRKIWVSGPIAQIIQEDERRCFVVCTNGILNVVDFTTGAVLSSTRSPAVHTVDGEAVYAWAPSLRRLLAFNFVDANRAFLGGPPVNSDGSSPDSITGYYPVPIATNLTRPIPLKPPRKGRSVPMLVRAVGDAGEAIASLPIAVTATDAGTIGTGSRITDAYGYALINLIGADAGLSQVTVTASVDGGPPGVVSGGASGGTGSSTGGGSSAGPTAPTLSAASGTSAGATTAIGSVSTDQGNGSLYTLFSTSATATAAEVKAGQVQGVTSTGTQHVNVTGLTAGTTYYPHYLHRNTFSLESTVVTGPSFTTVAVGGGGGSTGTRNPLKQPFASSSIWNTPIGSGAVYVPGNIDPNPENNQFAYMPGVDGEHIILTPTAPLTDIRYSSAGWSGAGRCTTTGAVLVSAPMAANYVVPNSNKNEGAAILLSDGRTIVQVQPIARCTSGSYATALVKEANVDLYGAGITGAHGGSGLSSIGGSIRLGELRPGQTGPKHALKVNVYAKQALFKATTRAEGYRWPAITSDSYAVGWYGTSGNNTNTAMKQGALLAIPASVDITALGLVTEPAKQLAWTLQNYGAYIVDDTYAPGFDFSVEEGAAGSKSAEFQADYGFAMAQRVGTQTDWVKDIQKIVAALHVVNNNTSSSIGGGGTPRQPLAPEISAP